MGLTRERNEVLAVSLSSLCRRNTRAVAVAVGAIPAEINAEWRTCWVKPRGYVGPEWERVRCLFCVIIIVYSGLPLPSP